MAQRTCSIQGCERHHKARGFCSGHYYAAKRRGELPVVMPMHGSPEECFAARTERDVDTGCLIWTGAREVDGYGRLGVHGKLMRAHRYAWERSNGPIPEGLFLDHTCYRPACVEIMHLRIATPQENAQNRSGAMPGSVTGVRGVHPNKKGFRASVRKGGQGYRSQTFSTIEEAALAAEMLRAELFGEFAGRG